MPTLRLLATVAVVGAVAGCCPEFEYKENFELATDADLNAVVGLADSVMIATADGQLIRASMRDGLRQDAVEFSVDLPLNAVAAAGDGIWAVGDEGTFVQKIDGGDWELVDLGTDARLLDVEVFDGRNGEPEWLIVVGDGVLRMQSFREVDAGEWFTPPEPAGGWGELRAVFSGEGIMAVGAAGVAWSLSGDPSEPWLAKDVGLGNVDLNGGGHKGYDPFSWIVGDAGSLAYYDGSDTYGAGDWTVVDTGVHEDLIAFAGGLALARDGRLFLVTDFGLVRLDKAAGLNRGIFSDGEGILGSEDVIVVGEGGRGRAYRRYVCPPW